MPHEHNIEDAFHYKWLQLAFGIDYKSVFLVLQLITNEFPHAFVIELALWQGNLYHIGFMCGVDSIQLNKFTLCIRGKVFFSWITD